MSERVLKSEVSEVQNKIKTDTKKTKTKQKYNK